MADPNCSSSEPLADGFKSVGAKKRKSSSSQMADPNCSSSEPFADGFKSGGAKKRKIERGMEILNADSSSSPLDLPDIAVNVVSFLALWDVFTLGSCSKLLNELCECEGTWKLLYIRRWGDPLSQTKAECSKGWKALYISKHKEKASLVHNIFESIKSCIINERYYNYDLLRETEKMKALSITFEDIYFFFFRRDINVIINFVALYYSYFCLHTRIKDIKQAVRNRQLAERVACIRWTYPKNWDYGFYTPEEKFTEIYSLGEIAKLENPALYLFKQPTYPQNNIREIVVARLSVSSEIPQIETECRCHCDCATNASSSSASVGGLMPNNIYKRIE